jgi:hypothetical protein
MELEIVNIVFIIVIIISSFHPHFSYYWFCGTSEYLKLFWGFYFCDEGLKTVWELSEPISLQYVLFSILLLFYYCYFFKIHMGFYLVAVVLQ